MTRGLALQAALDDFVRERSAPGVAMALCETGREPDYPHAGTVAFDATRRFDADSICRVYSMTKNITRIAAAAGRGWQDRSRPAGHGLSTGIPRPAVRRRACSPAARVWTRARVR